LFVISGPSGVGKTTLVKTLLAADPLLARSVSATTRSPRPGEVSGRDYLFVGRAEFERMKSADLVEWAEVHGELYGTPRGRVESELAAGRDIVLNIDIQGGDRVKRSFPAAVMIFILPPALASLGERLRRRGDVSAEDLEVRLKNARAEIGACSRYEYLVVNDDLARAGAELAAIVTAERCRRERKSAEFLSKLTE
jgi:guanylate kinase